MSLIGQKTKSDFIKWERLQYLTKNWKEMGIGSFVY